MILGRSSLIQTPCTLAQSSMSEHSSPAKTPGLAKRTLPTGSKIPHLGSRRQPCSLRRLQLRRNERKTMSNNEPRIDEIPQGLVVTVGRLEKCVVTEAADFVTSEAAGEWGMGRYTGHRLAPAHDEIAQLAYCFYELRVRQDGHDMEDWLLAEQELVRHCA